MKPRLRSILYMGSAMALHFGGYEFFRNACLALFTSSEYGFSNAAAFSLANALVSPFSLILLWFYARQLAQGGPRAALRTTTRGSIAFILLAAGALKVCRLAALPVYVGQAIIAVTFLFQNSYQYLLYTQHWSFVGSVLTPAQGARWFPALAGCSSLFCSGTSSCVPVLVPRTGILGLMALTTLTLTACAWASDRAYAIAQTHGFDPAEQLQEQKKDAKTSASSADQGRLGTALALFRRVPTLSVLFCEVLTFQSLSTILNVCFVRTLKLEIPGDVARTAYTGRFYGLVNAVSAALQFLVLPLAMKYAEPAWIWRLMPVLPLAFCVLQMVRTVEQSSSLALVAAAVFLCKTLDYALRSVVYPMVYQPLDFESRYVGKEIIGVFGSRFGKSGMSLL
jgi:ATP/ADP translocase